MIALTLKQKLEGNIPTGVYVSRTLCLSVSCLSRRLWVQSCVGLRSWLVKAYSVGSASQLVLQLPSRNLNP